MTESDELDLFKSEKSGSAENEAKTLDLIKKEIESYALVFPRIAFTLENSAKSREGPNKGRILTILPVRRTHSSVDVT